MIVPRPTVMNNDHILNEDETIHGILHSKDNFKIFFFVNIDEPVGARKYEYILKQNHKHHIKKNY